MELRLLVLRSNDPEKLAAFYTLLGLVFDYHKHGNSPFHYGASIGKTVLEIYPLTKSQSEPDQNLRLGFGIDNFDEIIQNLKDLEVNFLFEPSKTDFGYMTVISDPDGRKVELYKNTIYSNQYNE